jgi:signal transduction histidine kinase
VFTTGGLLPPPDIDTGADLALWLGRQGYRFTMTLPLVGAGQDCGWLALARWRSAFGPEARALAGQLAPLIALRLCFDRSQDRVAICEASHHLIDQKLRETASLRLRATLAAGAAHDIGNLFTSLLGYAEMLELDAPTALQPDIQMILKAVSDGKHILGRLQRTTPAAADDPIAATTQLRGVVQDAIGLTRPFWGSGPTIEIVTSVEDVPDLLVPAADLREVLVNLVMNAVAAMPEGGTLTLRSYVAGDQVVIEVIDTGQGIARERHSAIFQPFTTSRADGSGLGLSVSRAIVEAYGGTLNVQSALGQGATFRLEIPTRSLE